MRKAIVAGVAGAVAVATGVAIYKNMDNHGPSQDEDFDIEKFKWKDPNELTELDRQIAELAQKYSPDALRLLAELIRIPADHYEKDPLCGTSNHETPRLDYLRQFIIDNGAVESPEDVNYDEFGSLVWTVRDKSDNTPLNDLKVVYLDGHSDTVFPLRDNWHNVLGEGIDPFNGLTDAAKVDEEAMKKELGYIPPKDQWDHLLFGRGSADQLQGVVSQVFVTKILLETRALGSLRGAKVISVATVAEEDNDGGAPMHIMRKQHLEQHQVPDCVIMTEGTGDLELGPCGIYIGQRGRCQVEVEVIGKSCHGSMPKMGINPLEFGALIIAEATEQAKSGVFKDHKFLGKGTRTASKCWLDTPSDCAVPAKFTFRLDRRMTHGEDARLAIREIEELNSVKRARACGCTVNIRIPKYTEKSHKGVAADNDEDYLGWITHPTDPVVLAAVESYKRTVSPNVEEKEVSPENIPKKPRVQRWIFSTDGVGYPILKENLRFSIEKKHWTSVGDYVHPPMFGIGAGFEHHCHKLGEYLHRDHLWAPIAVMARFPSLFVQQREELGK
ncbi:Clan MH, family M20, peptidase T-like metallopeptidase [Tritrichomonas foetus]|uniref:Clan MH, family M20, peptidase T-like metallopeptidase n=1 Tax=Tritrichomonas foetus TaxID=1144522 RepID=A0A1J4L6R8_9EUKA|nr:Clan MH, family M20, peptidase T-like metallopeptidase [Tritrichomonas foetus]|eukprot:OHT17700.1 Clan MH, family M20, peptidase T-like metallopeptidase [Tritrichomonas foetus]